MLVVYLLVCFSLWFPLGDLAPSVFLCLSTPFLLLCICVFLSRTTETSEKHVGLGETQVRKQTNKCTNDKYKNKQKEYALKPLCSDVPSSSQDVCCLPAHTTSFFCVSAGDACSFSPYLAQKDAVSWFLTPGRGAVFNFAGSSGLGFVPPNSLTHQPSSSFHSSTVIFTLSCADTTLLSPIQGTISGRLSEEGVAMETEFPVSFLC